MSFVDTMQSLIHHTNIGYNQSWTSKPVAKCTISIINIKHNIKEPTHGYETCNIEQTLISSGYVNTRGSFTPELFFGSIPF